MRNKQFNLWIVETRAVSASKIEKSFVFMTTHQVYASSWMSAQWQIFFPRTWRIADTLYPPVVSEVCNIRKCFLFITYVFACMQIKSALRPSNVNPSVCLSTYLEGASLRHWNCCLVLSKISPPPFLVINIAVYIVRGSWIPFPPSPIFFTYRFTF